MKVYIEVIKNLKPKFVFRTVMGAISCFLSRPRAFSMPLRVTIENGEGCNFRCNMCALIR